MSNHEKQIWFGYGTIFGMLLLAIILLLMNFMKPSPECTKEYINDIGDKACTQRQLELQADQL